MDGVHLSQILAIPKGVCGIDLLDYKLQISFMNDEDGSN